MMFGMPPRGVLFPDDEENSPFKPQGPAAPWNGMPPAATQTPAPAEDSPWYKDKNTMGMMLAALSNGFGGMTLRGRGGMQQINNAVFAQGMKNQQNNKTLELLRTQNPKLYEIAKDLPPEYLGQFMQQHIKTAAGGQQFRTNTSGVQVDEATGRSYVVISDGEGGSRIKFLEDDQGNPLLGDTGQSKAETTIWVNGVNQAMEKGGEFFAKSESIDADIRLMREAKEALADGAQTGVARQYLPAFDEATQRLRRAANSAGIEVINSATFGALSEKEMALALSTGIPQGLNEQELDQYLTDRIAAQEKLYVEVYKRAQQLNSGTRTLGEWQDIWSEEKLGEYDDTYASRWSDLSYDRSGKKDDEDDDDDDIIDVTTPAPTLTPPQTGPRRRRY